jgi:hypothetical protein
VASRLSYHLWETMPDQELLDAAATGKLGSSDGFVKQVDRMLADPRTTAVFGRFFHEWLRLDSLDDLTANKADPRFKALAGKDLPDATLRTSMIQEIDDMIGHFVFRTDGTTKDLLTSDLAFARTTNLAAIYGVPAWDGKGAPASFAAGQRPGLLTRAAFHAFSSPQTRPVLKGVFVRDAILCDALPPPPPNVMATEPDISPTDTTRQVLEKVTEMEGSICVSCHGVAINPIGYATENIDSLGRLRTQQVLLDRNGKEIARAPVDTHGVPQIQYGDMRPVDGPKQLMDRIVESGKAEACLARQLFRYTFAVMEDVERDGCALGQMLGGLTGGAPVRRGLRESTLVASFRRRVIH